MFIGELTPPYKDSSSSEIKSGGSIICIFESTFRALQYSIARKII